MIMLESLKEFFGFMVLMTIFIALLTVGAITVSDGRVLVGILLIAATCVGIISVSYLIYGRE